MKSWLSEDGGDLQESQRRGGKALKALFTTAAGPGTAFVLTMVHVYFSHQPRPLTLV